MLDTDAVTHDDLIVLTGWMAQTGDHTTYDIAKAVRKPWSYVAEVAMVRAMRAHEAANPGHSPGQDLYGRWVCDSDGTDSVSECSWPDDSADAQATSPSPVQVNRARMHGVRL